MAFTYPFRYVPDPRVEDAAREFLRGDVSAFSEGKMMGVLITDRGPLFAFSGLVGGKGVMEGFVPPILDYSAPDGYFRRREAEISAMASGPGKSAASAALQDWLFSEYRVMNGLGEELSIKEIFALRGLVPPGGTGECAAPKLLNYAFRNGLRPLAMGEFWVGRPSEKEVREEGRFYPSCTGKCGPLLTWMLQGVDVDPNPLDAPYKGTEPSVIFSDDTLIVVSKPSRMLSVPGRTNADSLLEWLQARFGEVFSVHRLDMDTSGVMVYARTLEASSELQRQFENREVVKTYRARLSAGNEPFRHALKGTVALPLMLDYYDRPRQIVSVEGKKAITEYEVLEVLPDGSLDVRFRPLTGRSHQIRVHAAHVRGLGRPIIGDALYGTPSSGPLLLRAESIEFRHPVSHAVLRFESESNIR